MLASAGYPTWGLKQYDGMDLTTGHQLYGLALGYDWLYHDLDAETRKVVRACLQRRGRRMYEALLAGQAPWGDLYLHNHLWINTAGLVAAGLALFGEVEGTDAWVLMSLKKVEITMKSLGPDGASHEGVPYWGYGVTHLLKFMDLAHSLLGENLFRNSPWFEQTASFRLYSMLPRESWTRGSNVMTFADGPRCDFYPPDLILRKLAAEYRDGHAQWLANELSTAGQCDDSAAFLNLLWVDPSVAPQPPTDLPTFKHFRDLGLVFMRSSWDGREALMSFKCGPHIGHQALARYSYDPGGAHPHPDAGAFQLFAHGDWLIVPSGYVWKSTAFENTVLVNGFGQEGEGGGGFDGERLVAQKRGAGILRADHGAEYDYVIGDVAAAYKSDAGLRRFLRHILYLRPECWVIVDELDSASPSTFELYFHADFPFKQQDRHTFSVRGRNGALRLTMVAPEDVTAESWHQPLIGTDGRPAGGLEALKVANRESVRQTVFITVLEAYPAEGAPHIMPEIAVHNGQKILTLREPTRAWRLALQPDRSHPASPIRITVGDADSCAKRR